MSLYMLFEDWWGPHWRSARALARKAFDPLKHSALFAVAMVSNARSIRVLLSLGMEKVEKDHLGVAGFGHYQLAKTICRNANLKTSSRRLVMMMLCNSI